MVCEQIPWLVDFKFVLVQIKNQFNGMKVTHTTKVEKNPMSPWGII